MLGNWAKHKNGTISRMWNDAHNGYGNRDCTTFSLLSSDTMDLPEKWPRTFSKPVSPAIFYPSLWCIDRRPRKVSAPFPPPSSDSPPPFCPLAFSRRQILKSIEFPVGQTTKLPPNNPVVAFSTLCNGDVKYILSCNFLCFIRDKVKCGYIKRFFILKIYNAFTEMEKITSRQCQIKFKRDLKMFYQFQLI